ncbi:bifunctional DNA-formamidopyrimidine glycosylase/DNA-(apurinic or apyrimidinic site) lyase [Patulibacter defluvii]|uniref:bifunctional DNA-formamidopyrimidine glycosylase/DNA-(apurinic or apyrimidinic site) lyase n=1 Tax=Patulibacter defluvii TaxID=3095358 RepID=UPI002A751F1F|nr:bifunctional DNA-formamidopyrimidine glycosylase/DNA-(apurinic or apyrimidinic site) lyase [Patulibacter sp. DM4]
MPELPEVETIRRQLLPLVVGRTVTAATIDDPRWCAPQPVAEVEAALTGRRITAIDRRGKHLLWRTDGGTIAMHLRMTGVLLVDAEEGDAPYERVRLVLDGERTVRFCDPRRFGTGRWFAGDAEADRWIDERLGPEPLADGFDGPVLQAALRGRRAPIKGLLLDQRIVAGVGNIYADEALFHARVHPLRPGGQLTAAQCAALAEGIQLALADGIASGGATIDDFRHVDGVEGWFQNDFRVHRRAGEPCPACGTAVVKRVVAQRATYSCDRCQTKPRSPRVRPRR